VRAGEGRRGTARDGEGDPVAPHVVLENPGARDTRPTRVFHAARGCRARFPRKFMAPTTPDADPGLLRPSGGLAHHGFIASKLIGTEILSFESLRLRDWLRSLTDAHIISILMRNQENFTR
jgi:hypothetical protein